MNVHSDRESQLLAAAIRLSARVGADGFSMKALAQEAGLAVGTAYGHFDNREELLTAAYRRCVTEVAQVMCGALRPHCEYRENYRNVWMAFWEYCLANPDTMLCHEQFNALPSAQSPELWAFKLKEFSALSDWLSRSPEIRSLPEPLIAAVCFDPVVRLARMKLSGQLNDPESLLETLFQATLAALTHETTHD